MDFQYLTHTNEVTITLPLHNLKTMYFYVFKLNLSTRTLSSVLDKTRARLTQQNKINVKRDNFFLCISCDRYLFN